MKEKMPSIYQNRQSECDQLFIEAHEYEILKGKAQTTVPNCWDDDEEDQVVIYL